MSSLPKQFAYAGLVVCLTVAASVALAQGGGRRSANAGPVTVQPRSTSLPAPAVAGGGANTLAGIRPFPDGIGAGPSGGEGTHGYLMNVSPFSTTAVFPNIAIGPLLSGLSISPGGLFSLSGSFGDGGNIYHFMGGSIVLIGPGASGPDLAGLAYDSTGALWASGDSPGGFLDALFSVDVVSGIATPVGLFPMCGVGAIAEDPTTNVMYGFTGFCYDGSPGDVLIIDRVTGAATDIGIDLTDAGGSLPLCSIGGAAFAADGTGYASIGCRYGQVIEFTPLVGPWQFTVLGDAFTPGTGPLLGGSLTDIAVFN